MPSGIVEAVGPGLHALQAGRRGVLRRQRDPARAANSEFHLVDERIVGRKPASLPFAEAAALPLTTLTAWELMFDRMGISKSGAHAGKSVLILGGAGGVGSIAIQLAKKLAQAEGDRERLAAGIHRLVQGPGRGRDRGPHEADRGRIRLRAVLFVLRRLLEPRFRR